MKTVIQFLDHEVNITNFIRQTYNYCKNCIISVFLNTNLVKHDVEGRMSWLNLETCEMI